MSIHFQVCFNRPKNEFFFDITIQIIIIIVIIIIIMMIIIIIIIIII